MTEPVRIAVLRDVHAADRHDFGGNALRLVVEDANANGGVQGHPVELVERIVDGPAFGTQAHVDACTALWQELADDPSILGIIGPSTTPCVLAVHEAVERAGIPQIHWAGTDAACGDWHFQFQAGYLPDEGPAVAWLLTRLGHKSVVCFCGEGAYGDAYMNPFEAAACAQGIAILGRFGLPHTATSLDAVVAEAKALGADAVVGMGLLGVAHVLVGAMRAAEWNPPCFGNCGFALFAAGSPEAARLFSGWTTTDMHDPENAVRAGMADRYEARFGQRPASATASFGHDLAQLVVEALALAPEMTRAGLRAGLEALRHVPSATGGAGSYMALGPRDRQALKGPRLFTFSHLTPEGARFVQA